MSVQQALISPQVELSAEEAVSLKGNTTGRKTRDRVQGNGIKIAFYDQDENELTSWSPEHSLLLLLFRMSADGARLRRGRTSGEAWNEMPVHVFVECPRAFTLYSGVLPLEMFVSPAWWHRPLISTLGR